MVALNISLPGHFSSCSKGIYLVKRQDMVLINISDFLKWLLQQEGRPVSVRDVARKVIITSKCVGGFSAVDWD